MAARVLGISGSPVPDSNTDRGVKLILEHSGLEHEFIKLSQYTLSPCRACLGCRDDNVCVVDDDGHEIAEKFREADAFVLGGYTPYSSLDARTKTFMERMYCLRHQAGLNRGKVGVAVLTTACEPGKPGLPAAGQTAAAQITYWMAEEGMRHLGTLTILGNVPCLRCGHGDDCEMSGVQMLGGPEATVAGTPVRQFEQSSSLVSYARALAQHLREAVDAAAPAPGG